MIIINWTEESEKRSAIMVRCETRGQEAGVVIVPNDREIFLPFSLVESIRSVRPTQCCDEFHTTTHDDGTVVEMHTFGCDAIGRDENSHGRYV